VAQGKPRTVRVEIVVDNISNFDSFLCTIDVDFIVWLEWFDPVQFPAYTETAILPLLNPIIPLWWVHATLSRDNQFSLTISL
jgi:hypothetical protein